MEVVVPQEFLSDKSPQIPSDTSVFVVDDDSSVRRALERLIRSCHLSVETFASAKAYLSRIDKTPHAGPCCLILDVCMPDLDGLHLQEALANAGVPIIFLTGYGDVPTCRAAMKAGAVDFLTKPVEEEKLMSAVAAAARVSIASRKAAEIREKAGARFRTLTAREVEVMTCVVSGMLNKQIAEHLGAAEKTIKVHRGRVMEKMEVVSVADLVRVTQALGITPFAVAGRP